MQTVWSRHTRLATGPGAAVSYCVPVHAVCAVQPAWPAAPLWPASAAPALCAKPAHARHVLWPALGWYSPSAHDVQPAAPAWLCRPAVHAWHCMCPTSNVPGAHTSHAKRPTFFEPSAHVLHTPGLLPPQPVRTWPSGHAAHASQLLLPPAVWYSLLAATHATCAALPSHLKPAGHGAHSRSACVSAALLS